MGSAALPLGLTGISHSSRFLQLPSTFGLLGWACPKLATRRMFRGLDNNPVTSFAFTLDWDPFEDLLGFGLKPSRSRQRSSLKQDVKELPCADCRGRGYLSCTECDINSPTASCLQCAGKGIMTCRQCQGECVVQGNSVSVHEVFWEKLHSDSSIKVKDDEAIENMNIPVKTPRKRVYGPLSAATKAKISHGLKEFERRTGLISSRMKEIHRDPVLHAQRVSAIRKAVGTDEVRKHISAKITAFFRNPENRLKRSMRMRGIKYFCKACGQEGHKKNFCPSSSGSRARASPRCRYCGKVGHQGSACPDNDKRHLGRAPYKCSICHGNDHNARTCPQSAHKCSSYKCRICHGSDHNARTCPQSAHKCSSYKCSICHGSDHNARTCPQSAHKCSSYKCSICKQQGHNKRNCPDKEQEVKIR